MLQLMLQLEIVELFLFRSEEVRNYHPFSTCRALSGCYSAPTPKWALDFYPFADRQTSLFE